MSDNGIIDWMALSFVPGLGNQGRKQLLARFGSPERIFVAARDGLQDGSVRKNVLAGLCDYDALCERAVQLLRRLRSGGAEAICPESPKYPQQLQGIADPPPVLYVQGQMELLSSRCLAMVGSRAATSYGKRSSFTLAKELASAGLTVVSGLASGIDSEAHRGALSVAGGTIAVLGCGLDVVYPRENTALYEEIRRDGLLVTEYPLGTKPDFYRFPARNRIIAGLSEGVLVVEAARKSGSLITVEMALEEGRDVFAVPGQIDSFKSDGTHWLLQQGAQLVQSAEDILLGLVPAHAGSAHETCSMDSILQLDPQAQGLLNRIDVYGVTRDELIVASGHGPAKVTELLLLLELEGLVEMLPGNEIRRIA